MFKKYIFLSLAVHLFLIAAFYKSSPWTRFHMAETVVQHRSHFVIYDDGYKVKKTSSMAIQPVGYPLVIQKITVTAKRTTLRAPIGDLAENQEQQMLVDLIETYVHPNNQLNRAGPEQKL